MNEFVPYLGPALYIHARSTGKCPVGYHRRKRYRARCPLPCNTENLYRELAREGYKLFIEVKHDCPLIPVTWERMIAYEGVMPSRGRRLPNPETARARRKLVEKREAGKERLAVLLHMATKSGTVEERRELFNRFGSLEPFMGLGVEPLVCAVDPPLPYVDYGMKSFCSIGLPEDRDNGVDGWMYLGSQFAASRQALPSHRAHVGFLGVD